MTPKIVPDLYEMIYCKIGKSGRATGKKAMIWECANDVTIDSIIDLSHLMLAINSSVNVIIYTLRGKKHSFFEIPKFSVRSFYSGVHLLKPRPCQISVE